MKKVYYVSKLIDADKSRWYLSQLKKHGYDFNDIKLKSKVNIATLYALENGSVKKSQPKTVKKLREMYNKCIEDKLVRKELKSAINSAAIRHPLQIELSEKFGEVNQPNQDFVDKQTLLADNLEKIDSPKNEESKIVQVVINLSISTVIIIFLAIWVFFVLYSNIA